MVYYIFGSIWFLGRRRSSEVSSNPATALRDRGAEEQARALHKQVQGNDILCLLWRNSSR